MFFLNLLKAYTSKLTFVSVKLNKRQTFAQINFNKILTTTKKKFHSVLLILKRNWDCQMRFARIPAILSTVTDLLYAAFVSAYSNCTNEIFLQRTLFDNAFTFRFIFFTISLTSYNGWFKNVSNSV